MNVPIIDKTVISKNLSHISNMPKANIKISLLSVFPKYNANDYWRAEEKNKIYIII